MTKKNFQKIKELLHFHVYKSFLRFWAEIFEHFAPLSVTLKKHKILCDLGEAFTLPCPQN
jgi:hypothetical protein